MGGAAIDVAFWLPVLSPILSLVTGLGAVALTARAQRGNERRKHFETMRMEAYSDLMRGLAAQMEDEFHAPVGKPDPLDGVIAREVRHGQHPLVKEAIARIILYGSHPVLNALKALKTTAADTEANWDGFLDLLLAMRRDGFPDDDQPSHELLRIVLGK